jgi:membrane-associated protease RseP (regulator of RpoE activity)
MSKNLKLPGLVAVFVFGVLAGAVGAAAYLQEPRELPDGSGTSPTGEEVEAARAGPEAKREPAAHAVSPAAETDGSRADGKTREEAEAGPDLAASPDALEEVERLKVRWARIESELSGLRERIAGLERRAVSEPETDGGSASDVRRARTPDDRRKALRAAGVADDVASEIVWLQGQNELERLELRDRALREGWLGTDRYRDELRAIGDERLSLRDELGEDVYDRYLFAAGENNRIRIEGVIAGSVAEEAGFSPGDTIETYDGKRVFTFAELRNATSEGERDELVSLEIRRADGSVVEFLVPRGPLGVRLDLTRADPEG